MFIIPISQMRRMKLDVSSKSTANKGKSSAETWVSQKNGGCWEVRLASRAGGRDPTEGHEPKRSWPGLGWGYRRGLQTAERFHRQGFWASGDQLDKGGLQSCS